MGPFARHTHPMTAAPTSPSPARPDASADWLDQLLASDAADHGGDYIADSGFTARIMQALPVRQALPAWRTPAVVAMWLVAAALLATSLPGTAHEVAREAFRLFAGKAVLAVDAGIRSGRYRRRDVDRRGGGAAPRLTAPTCFVRVPPNK